MITVSAANTIAPCRADGDERGLFVFGTVK